MEGRGPHRTCVACRRRAPAGDLVRLVVEDGKVVPRPHGGRGAWVCPTRTCVTHLEKRPGIFTRALRTRCPDAGGLLVGVRTQALAQIERALVRAHRDGLVARGAGALSQTGPVLLACDAGRVLRDRCGERADVTDLPLSREAIGQLLHGQPTAVLVLRQGHSAAVLGVCLQRHADLG